MGTNLLTPFEENIFTVQRPYRVLGMELGVRMTVIRLQDGGLFLHSPVRLDPELKKEMDSLGPVRCLVGPNLFHHLSLRPWREDYPEARLFGVSGLPEKRKNLKFDGVLGETPPPEWAGQIEQVAVKGMPKVNEVVFFHPKSRTLLLTDLAFHIRNDSPFSTRLLFRLINGGYGRMAPTRLFKTVIKDRKAFRSSLDRILEWDFDKVILSHGHLVHDDGKEAFRKAFEGI